MTSKLRLQPHVVGMVLMGCVGLGFAVHDTVSNALILSLPVIFVAWVRYLVHTCVISGVILARGDRIALKTRRPWLHLVRAFCLLGDSLTFLFGLSHVSLAESTALVFLAPAFVTILSPIVFGTKASTTQWISVIVGFVGVIIIVNPSNPGFSLWYLFPLATAFFFALYQVLTQMVGEDDSPATCSLYVGIFSTAILTLIVPFYWATPTFAQWALLVALGALGLGVHFLISKAYQYASSVILAPLGYLQIVFATIAGIIVFGSYPAAISLIGIGLVLVSGLLVYAKRLPVL